MRYFLFICILSTFILGSWQAFRFNYKLKLKHNIESQITKGEIIFNKNSFKKFKIHNITMKTFFRFYIGENSYKILSLIADKERYFLIDLGSCIDCKDEKYQSIIDSIKDKIHFDLNVFLMPISKFNYIKKFLFKNDNKNNIWFYYDWNDLYKISDSKFNIEDYNHHILYNMSDISDDIIPNIPKLFNPHLFYLIFWYSSSASGLLVYYIAYVNQHKRKQ